MASKGEAHGDFRAAGCNLNKEQRPYISPAQRPETRNGARKGLKVGADSRLRARGSWLRGSCKHHINAKGFVSVKGLKKGFDLCLGGTGRTGFFFPPLCPRELYKFLRAFKTIKNCSCGGGGCHAMLVVVVVVVVIVVVVVAVVAVADSTSPPPRATKNP